jgi:integrase
LARHTTNCTGVIYRDSITNKKSDKIYYIRYKDENNKTKELKIGKFSEGVRENYCNQIRNEIITKMRLGEVPPSAAKNRRVKKILLDEIKEIYFEKRREGKSKQSDLASYKKHLEPFFKNLNLELITKEDIRKLQKTLKEKKNPLGKPLSIKTIHNILTIFKSITSFAIKEELLKNDYKKYVEMDSVRNQRDRYLTTEEIYILYDHLKDDKRLFLFSKIALTTGARLASILYISKKDIDFSNQLITIYDLKKDQEARVSYPSFLTEEVTLLLKEWSKELKPNDKIFHKTPSSIQKQMLKILNDLFNQDIDYDDRRNKAVVHTLRHTFASHLAINGTPIFTIQKLMNHSDIKMTLRYAKLAPESGKDAIRGLYQS